MITHTLTWGSFMPYLTVFTIFKYSIIIAILIGIAILGRWVITRKMQIASTRKKKLYNNWVAYSIFLQEEERKRIASSLHDNFCARLSIIKLMLRSIPTAKLPEEIFAKLDEAYHAARSLSHELDSPVLENMGLLEAIREYIRPLYGTLKIEIRVLHIFSQKLATQVELNLFRIVQETIANILRHAHANTVHIDIHFSRQQAALRISDNGIGFNAETQLRGTGLKNIHMRVAFLKGNYRLRSCPDKGTTLVVAIPISAISNNSNAFLPTDIFPSTEDIEKNTILTNQSLYTNEYGFIPGSRR